MVAFMIWVPKPCRSGGLPAGPPLSTQLTVRFLRSLSQEIATRPDGTDSAPYFAALVASSCTTSARLCAIAGLSETEGPEMLQRSVLGPQKGAISSSLSLRTSAPCQRAADRRVW